MSQILRIAIASGKGGTGKTTLATGLAFAFSGAGFKTAYLDCDVEEPNGHLFCKPTIDRTQDVSCPVPKVDQRRCTSCGACAAACRYSAIASLPDQVLTFPMLCHGCGACQIACPENAIVETRRIIGVVETGTAQSLDVVQGRLNVGEAMAPPVIRAVQAAAPNEGVIVVDAPPGTSCPVIAAVRTADVLLLVTEPTPFGLNDLKLIVAMARKIRIPFGVVVNRSGIGDNAVLDYCKTESIPVLLVIPDDRRIGRAGSDGGLCTDAVPELVPRFVALYQKLEALSRTSVPEIVDVSPTATDESIDAQVADRNSFRQTEDKNGTAIPELVVISGKGGTGKTSVVASLAVLSKRAATADCDVDAANLHLILDPTIQERRPFSAGYAAILDPTRCTACGECIRRCRFDAIATGSAGSEGSVEIDDVACEGCGVCADVCPAGAITLETDRCGEWFVSTTRCGPMVHARLGIAKENSGKLVSLVRREAQPVARTAVCDLLVSDGSPGIGCPVIASISGARLVLVVTEPTMSGMHDFRRVAALCRQLNVTAGLCINRVDLNSRIAQELVEEAFRWGMPTFGTIRSDSAVTEAQLHRLSVVEYGDSIAARDIRALWSGIRSALKKNVHIEGDTDVSSLSNEQ